MKFSVIVPIYNCENYLKDCLDSMLAQTFSDWECLCVDDGCTDLSGKIADEYAAVDPRFKVIHKSNGGEGSARNAGLEVCQGEWIYFLDSDDVLNNRTLEMCNIGADLYPNTDLVAVKMMQYRDGDLPNYPENDNISWNAFDISHQIVSPAFGLSVPRVAYKATIIKELRFGKLKVGADRVFIIDAIERSKLLVECNYIGYGYRTREGSIVNSAMTSVKFLDDLAHRMYCINSFKSSKKEYSSKIIYGFGKDFIEYMSYCFFQMKDDDQRKSINTWAVSMKEAHEYPVWTLWQKFVMKVFGLTKSRVVIWTLGYLPYWLKIHGINRSLHGIAKYKKSSL